MRCDDERRPRLVDRRLSTADAAHRKAGRNRDTMRLETSPVLATSSIRGGIARDFPPVTQD
jgi:hypothetical protein